MVSNRLPVTIDRDTAGSYVFKESSGGPITGMSGVKREFDVVWYGWAGIEIPSDEEYKITQTLRQKHNAVPVLLDDGLAEAYYNGFSSTLLCFKTRHQRS